MGLGRAGILILSGSVRGWGGGFLSETVCLVLFFGLFRSALGMRGSRGFSLVVRGIRFL